MSQAPDDSRPQAGALQPYRWISATYGSGREQQPGNVLQPPPEAGPRTFTLLQRPEIKLQWASDFPDAVKVRKPFRLPFLSFVLGGTWRKRDNVLNIGCTCKDRLLGGDISLDAAQKLLQYRRSFPVADGARLALSAQCSYAELHKGMDSLKPVIGMRYEFGRGSASLGPHSLHVQRHLPITHMVGLEVLGTASLPSPAAELAFTDHNQTSASLDGPLAFTVSQANLVIRL